MGRFIITGLILCVGIFLSCNENNFQEEIPYAFFEDKLINLDLPEFNNLAIDNGYLELNDIGVRGIIVFRESASNYHAFERICSYHPSDACATINVHSSGLYLFCPCCNSTFSPETGFPTGGGPAEFPLREYRTYLDSRTLVITDEPL